MQLLADKQYGDIQEIGRYAGPVMGKRGTGRLAGHKDFKKKQAGNNIDLTAG
jgi:hypothetical protein